MNLINATQKTGNGSISLAPSLHQIWKTSWLVLMPSIIHKWKHYSCYLWSQSDFELTKKMHWIDWICYFSWNVSDILIAAFRANNIWFQDLFFNKFLEFRADQSIFLEDKLFCLKETENTKLKTTMKRHSDVRWALFCSVYAKNFTLLFFISLKQKNALFKIPQWQSLCNVLLFLCVAICRFPLYSLYLSRVARSDEGFQTEALSIHFEYISHFGCGFILDIWSIAPKYSTTHQRKKWQHFCIVMTSLCYN